MLLGNSLKVCFPDLLACVTTIRRQRECCVKWTGAAGLPIRHPDNVAYTKKHKKRSDCVQFYSIINYNVRNLFLSRFIRCDQHSTKTFNHCHTLKCHFPLKIVGVVFQRYHENRIGLKKTRLRILRLEPYAKGPVENAFELMKLFVIAAVCFICQGINSRILWNNINVSG